MRRVRYAVASSLDGFIAGPKGEADWIIMDPDIDFQALYKQFDTVLMGRKTFEAMGSKSGGRMPGMETFVFSRTLQPREHPQVTVVTDPKETLAGMRAHRGKDIWLFGGGSLFRSLADLRLVDTVEVAVIPVMLGAGVPLVAPPANKIKLTLNTHKVYRTGIVSLEYGVV
jgi:dihydrofolate reductase